MSLEINTGICDQCGTCISVCPSNSLMLTDVISIDHDKCTLCKNCITVCPVAALKEKK